MGAIVPGLTRYALAIIEWVLALSAEEKEKKAKDLDALYNLINWRQVSDDTMLTMNDAGILDDAQWRRLTLIHQSDSAHKDHKAAACGRHVGKGYSAFKCILFIDVQHQDDLEHNDWLVKFILECPS